MRRLATLVILAAASNVLGTPLAAQAPARKVVAGAPDPAGFTILQGRAKDGGIIQAARLNGVMLLMRESNADDERTADDVFEGDDYAEEDEIVRRRLTIQFTNGTLDEFVFGKGAGSTTTQSVDAELRAALRDAIEQVHMACQLRQQQRRRLELAGRGDIKRFLDRVDRLKAALRQTDSIRTPEQFRDWATPLGQEGETLRRMLTSGVFEKDSLFDKTRKTILSSDQSEQFAVTSPRGSKVPGIPVGGWLNGEAPDYRGKPYLIHLWATASAPSLHDLPTLRKLASQGACIMGVHALRAPEFAIADIIRSEELPYPTLAPTHAAMSSYLKIDGCQVQSLPFCIVVDRNGFVVAHGA